MKTITSLILFGWTAVAAWGAVNPTGSGSGGGVYNAITNTQGPVFSTNGFIGPDNAKFWGAIGNGITNEVPAIQARINAMATTGGRLYFPAGTYLVNSALILSNAAGGAGCFMIYGDGPAATILRTTGTNDIFRITNCTDFAISGINFQTDDQQSESTNGCGLRLQNSTYGKIDNCKFISFTRGISFDGTSGNNHTIDISRCVFIRNGTGIYGSELAVNALTIGPNNEFQSTGYELNRNGIQVSGFGVRVVNNTIQGVAKGLILGSGNGITVDGNYFELCTNAVISLGSISYLSGISIVNNFDYETNALVPFVFFDGNTADGLLISGNNVFSTNTLLNLSNATYAQGAINQVNLNMIGLSASHDINFTGQSTNYFTKSIVVGGGITSSNTTTIKTTGSSAAPMSLVDLQPAGMVYSIDNGYPTVGTFGIRDSGFTRFSINGGTVSIPGALNVGGAATFTNNLRVQGTLSLNELDVTTMVLTNTPDSITNTWTINSTFPVGANTLFLTSGTATGGVTGIANGPTSTERYGQLTIISTGDLDFTNIASIHTSDFVATRRITNGNTCVISIDVMPGRCTNMAIVQFR